MSEDREALLRKISQVAGRINRHRNQSETPSVPSYRGGYAPYPLRGRGSNHWQPPRGRGHAAWAARGGGRGRGVVYNRTLVINNRTPSTGPSGGGPASAPTAAASSSTSPTTQQPQPAAAGPGWVAKNDRHMQLINTSIYDQEIQARAKAMEKTRKEKADRKAEIEKQKLQRFLQTDQGHSNHKVDINGEQYLVTAGGSKLVRVSGNSVDTPWKAVVGGVEFQRSRNGNLVRAGLVRASRLSKLVHQKSTELCKFYTIHGRCNKAQACPYVHDPEKVAICPAFLASGSCPDGNMCDLSHDPTPHRVPVCHHFVRGNCTNQDCRYAHVRVNPAAPVCRRFAMLGYCPKGSECAERHVRECPDCCAAAAAELAKGFSEYSDEDEEDDNSSVVSDVDSDIVGEEDLSGNRQTDDSILKEDFISF
ncbi:hypothetical protein FPQ18DRAFT_329614 [Pyronema domesticum]|nr:hypothetical protein FPQ18DRAFT_329614 [Pyronema domesticum]